MHINASSVTVHTHCGSNFKSPIAVVVVTAEDSAEDLNLPRPVTVPYMRVRAKFTRWQLDFRFEGGWQDIRYQECLRLVVHPRQG